MHPHLEAYRVSVDPCQLWLLSGAQSQQSLDHLTPVRAAQQFLQGLPASHRETAAVGARAAQKSGSPTGPSSPTCTGCTFAPARRRNDLHATVGAQHTSYNHLITGDLAPIGRVHLVGLGPDVGDEQDAHILTQLDADANMGAKKLLARRKGPFKASRGPSRIMDRSAHVNRRSDVDTQLKLPFVAALQTKNLTFWSESLKLIEWVQCQVCCTSSCARKRNLVTLTKSTTKSFEWKLAMNSKRKQPLVCYLSTQKARSPSSRKLPHVRWKNTQHATSFLKECNWIVKKQWVYARTCCLMEL